MIRHHQPLFHTVRRGSDGPSRTAVIFLGLWMISMWVRSVRICVVAVETVSRGDVSVILDMMVRLLLSEMLEHFTDSISLTTNAGP